MFPDTSNFTDPAYTDPSVDPLTGIPDFSATPTSDMVAVNPFYSNDFASPSNPSPSYTCGLYPCGSAANTATPAQSSGSGVDLLGWLKLGEAAAQTGIAASKTGSTTRPGVNKSTASMGSFGSLTTTTLLVIVAIFVGVVFMLRKR